MFELFDPIVKDIKTLVYHHIRGVQSKNLNLKVHLVILLTCSSTKLTQAIVLCGELDSNGYLSNELIALCGSDVRIIQPEDPFVHTCP